MAKTGLVEITKLMEHIERTVTKYAAAVQVGVALGVSSGTITSAEGAAILAALASISTALSAIKKLTGY